MATKIIVCALSGAPTKSLQIGRRPSGRRISKFQMRGLKPTDELSVRNYFSILNKLNFVAGE
jgi:hypothetical protein